MMKKFFYLSAILAIVLVSCNSEKEYIAKLSNTASMIEKEADLSEAIALHYCDTWRKVIYDHEYNGEYCTDFNEALAKHQEFIITTDTYKRLKQKRDSIEAIMPQLNDYPSSCKDAYNELVSIYADTDELFRFADEPRGSLSTYSTKTTDLYQKIEKSLKEFKIKHIQNKYLKKELYLKYTKNFVTIKEAKYFNRCFIKEIICEWQIRIWKDEKTLQNGSNSMTVNKKW